MPKLTDTQLVILSAAAKREDRAILPLPKSLKCNNGAVTTVLKSLLSRGLVAEQPATPGESAWREEDDRHFGLVLAEAGMESFGIEPAVLQARQPKSKSNRTTKDKESDAAKTAGNSHVSRSKIRDAPTQQTSSSHLWSRKPGVGQLPGRPPVSQL